VLLARGARAQAAEKKPLVDDLRRVLLAYLQPLLGPEAPAAKHPRRKVN
jgi:hypothetical protein